MFKADWTERPAVKVWRDLVKTKWWIREELRSGADGKVVTPGCFGWYDITVERDGKTRTVEAKHAADGSAVMVTMA